MKFGNLKRKFIGKRSFYAMILAIAVPIMVQNGITNFVNMIDNIMVGRVGTNEMSGVAIVNQLIMVFNLCIFGGVAGAGIFTAQFHGARNTEGIRHTFRYKLIVIAIIATASIAVFLCFGDELIKLYLNGETGDVADIEETFRQAEIYLSYMLIGLPPFAIAQAYGDTLRCSEETIVPMKAGIVSVLVNLSLNYVLIYGKLGAPALGVAGAAIATIIARYVEMAVVVIWTHTHSRSQPFIKGAFKNFKIPVSLTKDMIAKGMPLILETTNSDTPIGGVNMPIIIFIVTTTPKCTGSIPNAIATGTSIGMTSNCIAIVSITHPSMTNNKSTASKNTMGLDVYRKKNIAIFCGICSRAST